jgi:hypothetical protein
MANIADLIADRKALRIIARKLQDALVNIPTSRQEKLDANPDHDQYDLGYQTCLNEINLRVGEVLDEVGNLLAERDIQLPNDDEMAGPVTFRKRIGRDSDFNSIYESAPSAWNDMVVGEYYQTRYGAVAKVIAKDRKAETVTLEWAMYSAQDRVEVVKAGSDQIDGEFPMSHVKYSKKAEGWVKVPSKKE